MLEEALLCCEVISPEDPLQRNKSSSAILRSAYDGFVNLNNMPDAAEQLRIPAVLSSADVTAKTEPIRDGPGRHAC